MHSVTKVDKVDVLRGLKKFRRLAKQDLLASPYTSEPDFWRKQAEARRETYQKLTEYVELQGVVAAYQLSLDEYVALPLLCETSPDPRLLGLERAYEMFMAIVGVDPKEMTRLKNARKPVSSGASSGAKTPLNAI